MTKEPTAIERAITRAIEGGYGIPSDFIMVIRDDSSRGFHFVERGVVPSVNDILLDPAFWQALGRAEGWWESFPESSADPDTYWVKQWHGLIDALASGQSPESYLASILTPSHE